MHRDFEAATHKKRSVINHAIVATEGTARRSLRFRDGIVAQRSLGPEPRHSFVNFATAVAPKLEPHGISPLVLMRRHGEPSPNHRALCSGFSARLGTADARACVSQSKSGPRL